MSAPSGCCTCRCCRAAGSTSPTAACRCCSTSTSPSTTARWSRCSAPTAPASRRCCVSISGVGLADAGTVRLDGADITYLDAERRVGRGVTQIPGGKAVFGPMTVVDNMRGLRLQPRHASGRRSNAGIEESFAAFPRLAERRDQLASTLSGGEQQMLALSKAFIVKPRLLLIDELSLGLAPKVVGELLEMVRRINASGYRRRAGRAVGEHRPVGRRPRLLHGEGGDPLRRPRRRPARTRRPAAIGVPRRREQGLRPDEPAIAAECLGLKLDALHRRPRRDHRDGLRAARRRPGDRLPLEQGHQLRPRRDRRVRRRRSRRRRRRVGRAVLAGSAAGHGASARHRRGLAEVAIIRRLRTAPKLMSLVATLGVAQLLLFSSGSINARRPERRRLPAAARACRRSESGRFW